MTRSQILPAAVLVLSLAISSKAVASEWGIVGLDKTKIVFNGPNLLGTGQFAKRSSGSQVNEQVGMWITGTRYPRAEIYIQELWPNFVRTRQSKIENEIKTFKFLSSARLDPNAKQMAINVLGRIEYYKFALKGLHCVGFGQHYGVGPGWDNDTGILPNYLIGYYCDDETLSDNTVEAIVLGLGVKDFRVPSASSN